MARASIPAPTAEILAALEVIMNFVDLHLMFNHVPVFGVLFGLMIGLVGVFARSKGVTRVGLGALVLSALVAIPVYLTGDSAEEIVEGLPGVTEGFIGQHESAATVSLILVCVSGVFALATLVFGRSLTSKVPGYLMAATMVVTVLTGASMIKTANLGGQVRHTEIRSGAAPATNGEAGTTEKPGGGAKTDDDDD